MKNNDEFFENEKDDDEDLLEFEFDELSEEDDGESIGDSSSDEEVIELVDVVERGEVAEESESEEIARLLDSEADEEKQIEFDEESDFAPSEFGQIPEGDVSQGLDSEMESVVEDLEPPDLEPLELEPVEPEPSEKLDSDFELLESDLEVMADAELFRDSRVESEELHEFEATQEEPVEAAGMESATPDIPPELPHEDLGDVVSTFKGQPETEGVVASRSAEELIGISEERIEAIITKAVQDVVERVARETMATVAERVITESIDALRESLQPPQS